MTNIYQAKTNLSQLVNLALAGEEVIIARAGTPMVKLVPYEKPQKKRVPGRMAGKIWISDNFNDEDLNINKLFYG